jgi:RNA polymerase sigma-70 factor (ECF subfamily)
MHDVFVQVLKRRDVLEHRAPSSLLYTIATNTCLNKLRARKRRPEIAGDDVVEQIASLESTEEAVLSRHFLDRLFAREPETTRTIAVLHYVDRLTLEETAEHVGLSVSGVRKRLRGLRKKGLALREI